MFVKLEVWVSFLVVAFLMTFFRFGCEEVAALSRGVEGRAVPRQIQFEEL